MKLFKNFFQEQEGQDAIEYALLAGFVSLAIVLTVTTMGKDVDKVYKGINTQLESIPGL